MFKSISWETYWFSVSIVLISYYAIISLKYYSDECKQVANSIYQKIFKKQDQFGVINNLVTKENKTDSAFIEDGNVTDDEDIIDGQHEE